jgi:hypothetical protein
MKLQYGIMQFRKAGLHELEDHCCHQNFPKTIFSSKSANVADALYFNFHDIAQLHMMEQRDAVSQV